MLLTDIAGHPWLAEDPSFSGVNPALLAKLRAAKMGLLERTLGRNPQAIVYEFMSEVLGHALEQTEKNLGTIEGWITYTREAVDYVGFVVRLGSSLSLEDALTRAGFDIYYRALQSRKASLGRSISPTEVEEVYRTHSRLS